MDRPHVDVGVGNLQPRYREPDLLRFEAFLDGLADGLGDRHKVCGQPGTEVDPVVGLFFGDDERVARGEGSDVQEGHARTVVPDAKRAGTSPSMMRVKTVPMRHSSYLFRAMVAPQASGAPQQVLASKGYALAGASPRSLKPVLAVAPDSSSDSLARNSIMQGFFSV